MPFMEERPHPKDTHLDSRRTSPIGDASPKEGALRSAIEIVESSDVSYLQKASGSSKRKRDPVAYPSGKKPREELNPEGPYTSPTRSVEGQRDRAPKTWESKTNSSRDTSDSPALSSVLPAQIWSKIFMFLPPQDLGQLLQVNRTFHDYLEATKKPHASHDEGDGHILDTADSERIWKTSRRRYYHHLPRPLYGNSELDMWKLIGGRGCQFCAQKADSKVRPGHQTNSPIQEPVGQGIRIFWPLAIRCCTICLSNETFTEAELLSFGLSFLLPTLPFTVISSDSGSGASLRLGKAIVSPLSPKYKRYLQHHVNFIREQTHKVARSYGSAAAEEWLKGLEVYASHRQRDALRWERWENNGGAKQLRFPKAGDSRFAGPQLLPNLALFQSNPHHDTRRTSPARTMQSSLRPTFPYLPQGRDTSPPSLNTLEPSASFESAQKAKSLRVIKIIQRAAELDPPLPLSVLRHIPAFQAAHNIPRQLQDSEWPLLQSRFQEQRAEAEQLAQVQTEKVQISTAMPNPVAGGVFQEPARAETTVPEEIRLDNTTDYEAYQEKRKQFAETLSSVFRQTYSVIHIPRSVRVFTALHHTIARFEARFGAEPPLDLISDALTNESKLGSVRAAKVLHCGLCVGRLASSAPNPTIVYNLLLLIIHFHLCHVGAERDSNSSANVSRVHLVATLASGNTITWFQSLIQIPNRSLLERLLVPLNISTPETMQLYKAVLPFLPESAVPVTANSMPTGKLPVAQQDLNPVSTSSLGAQITASIKQGPSQPRYIVPALRSRQQEGGLPNPIQTQRIYSPQGINTEPNANPFDRHDLPPETGSANLQSTREPKEDPDHPESARVRQIRSRSRSPARDRTRQTISYREREDPRYIRQYPHDVYPHPVRTVVAAQLRGGDSEYPHPSPIYARPRSVESLYEYRHPPPPQPVTPRVLYDEYGNEYVHRSAAQQSYILYPLPPREYY